MVKEVRQYTVKGMFAVEPRTLGAVGTTSDTVIEPEAPTVAVRLTPAGSNVWAPMGQDELTVIVPQEQASRWQFGKSFTMTITED